MELAGPLTRVLLRYLAGPLMVHGLVNSDLSDPDIMTLAEFGVGALISLVTEGWWRMARCRGWSQ